MGYMIGEIFNENSSLSNLFTVTATKSENLLRKLPKHKNYGISLRESENIDPCGC